MRQLTPEGQAKIDAIAQRHGFSAEAAAVMLAALERGHAGMAQFDHPEFGGSGQWMRGGMTMVGDMFDSALRARVAALCDDLAALAAGAPAAHETRVSFFSAGGESDSDWWPSELGTPDGSGSQNHFRYAYFGAKRRLAIESGGRTTVYDTLDHRIGGVAQQQSTGGSLTLTSQHGLVDVASLPVVTANAEAPRSHAEPAAAERAVHDTRDASTVSDSRGDNSRGASTVSDSGGDNSRGASSASDSGGDNSRGASTVSDSGGDSSRGASTVSDLGGDDSRGASTVSRGDNSRGASTVRNSGGDDSRGASTVCRGNNSLGASTVRNSGGDDSRGASTVSYSGDGGWRGASTTCDSRSTTSRGANATGESRYEDSRGPAAYGESTASHPRGSAATDVLATIERLAELERKGVVTAQEFADKKSELLRRL